MVTAWKPSGGGLKLLPVVYGVTGILIGHRVSLVLHMPRTPQLSHGSPVPTRLSWGSFRQIPARKRQADGRQSAPKVPSTQQCSVSSKPITQVSANETVHPTCER